MWRRFALGALLCGSCGAAPWEFGDPLTLAGQAERPHFHHLDGAGRRHLAVSADRVAAVWEDDHSGAPQVYAAIREAAAPGFAQPLRLSEGTEAYEPALAGLPDGRWLVAWEQDGSVWARLIGGPSPGPAVQLAGEGSRQVTLASDPAGRVAAVWARDQAGGQLLEAALLALAGSAVTLAEPALAVAPLTDHPYQAFPAATWVDGALLVAWEDRRAGHTRLFASRRAAGGAFAPEVQLNEHQAPVDDGREVVGLGSGVMRVMLDAGPGGVVRAIWLDKRNAASGYAVWGAASGDGGERYGANRIVQDEQGAAVQQWHAALAGGPPGFVAAWDDTREAWSDESESGDLLLSWNLDGEWSADLLVPGASGPGYQGSPAVALDAGGDLHLLWIERDDLSAPTRLRYLRGSWRGGAP